MMEIKDERAEFDTARGFEDFEGLDGYCDDLSIDIEAFFDILEEKPDSIKIEHEEQRVIDTNRVGLGPQSGTEELNEYSSFEVKPTFSNADALDNPTRLVGETFNNGLKFEPVLRNQSPVGTEAAIQKEWFTLNPDSYRVGISHYEMPSCITTPAFPEVNNSCVIDSGNHQTFRTMDDSKDAQGNMFLNTCSFAERQDHDLDINYFESKPTRFTELSSDANVSLSIATSTTSAVSHGSDVIDLTRSYSALACSLNTDFTQMDDSSGGFLCGNFQIPFSPSNGGEINSGSNAAVSVKEDRNEFSFGISPSIICPEIFISRNGEQEELRSVSDGTYHQYEDIGDSSANSLTSALSEHMDFSSSGEHYPSSCQVTSSEIQLRFISEELNMNLSNSKMSNESIQSGFSDCQYIDDDPDICILEDISQPAPSTQASLVLNRNGNSQPAMFGYQDNFPRAGGPRIKANDERLLRVALQDLSQPRSEATPPDGVLAVPLLRHQRIALSWMVKQETSGQYCCGGILADDQGLGKTVSTIALILKERAPSVRAHPPDVKKAKLETFNLDDDDDDGAANMATIKQESDSCHVKLKGSSRGLESWVQVKGKPAAGTLIVCPTSVLRQWAEELHNKVTREANLTVLVYHGSNRTKDPSELVKYDVVLTTYSIVSMEFPKKPSLDEYADEKRKSDADDFSVTVTTSSMKRKKPVNCEKKRPKHRKSMNGALLDSVARPLAKVAWFRIVLDEAQSIKNHRTQAARACWGLRAKRRWCLSGTPIQNAIDDLYSYFRFLRCDQYAVYSDFCSKIKNVISKNPQKGYSRLQTILKFVMLRRTKGTLLDGQPIINLPPKYIELKKVEFTDEERDFYSRLEIATSAQFKEYEAAGTVKQNYVNILLMLLRLRQACDHPLLVNGFDSNSPSNSTVLVAQNLSQEAQTNLLRCPQASLALCGICNDSPEDAVVAVCGHVFCNQCIHEHLFSDDRQCPSSNCKVRLSLSTIFSKATLESSTRISEQLVENISPDCTDPEVCNMSVPCSNGIPHHSSKIRAAIEVLQSLGKPEGPTSGNSCNEISLDGNHAKNGSVTGKCPSDSVKVTQEKAIVFSQWTRMLDIFEVELKSSSIQYRRLDGTMSVTARDKAVKDFNALPEVSVIIMSLKAASLGLNMVAACRVILLDLWWNPTTEDQAVDRAHRIGQTRPVTVLRLTVKDTVEDRILALQQKKREMVAHAFGEDESGGQQTRLTVEDLQFLFNG